MTEELGSYTCEHNSQTDCVHVNAWSGPPDGGYQFTFFDEEKKYRWFSISGKQLEDLYMLHLQRKIDGLETMERVRNPMLIDYRGLEYEDL